MRCYICETLHGKPNVPFCSEAHAEQARHWLEVDRTETCPAVRWTKEMTRHVERWDAQKERNDATPQP